MKAAHVLTLVFALVPLRTAIPKDRAFVLDRKTYTPVPYCELVRNPMEYDGKRIAVRSGYMLGFEEEVMLSLKCRDLTLMAFKPETVKAERVLQKARRHWGTFNATFYGTFHKEILIKMVGIQDSYQFDVQYMANIEAISKKAEYPNALSKKAQKKLCQGTEMPKKP
jgi:hypothetical protein